MVTTIHEVVSTDVRARENREVLQQLLDYIAPKVEARLRQEGLSDPNPVIHGDEEALSPDDDCPRIAEIIREVISGCLDEIVLRGRNQPCETAKITVNTANMTAD
jgi:hypothetical protein